MKFERTRQYAAFCKCESTLAHPAAISPYALADEAADRIAISRGITTLNDSTQPSALFTQRGYYEFEGLRRAHPRAFQIFGPASADVTVTISHEPWGEATINFPGRESRPSIVYVTPAVALAEGMCTHETIRALGR
jgi:hypothetical protein